MKKYFFLLFLSLFLLSCNKDEIESLEFELEETKTELNEKQSELDEANQQLYEIRSSISDLGSDISSLTSSVDMFSSFDWKIVVPQVFSSTSDVESSFNELESKAEER